MKKLVAADDVGRQDAFPSPPPSSERLQEFHSPADIAAIVGLNVAVVRRAIGRGELRAYKICGKLRICRSDFDEWLDRCLVRT